ncbi:hypothetical protein LK540_09995 [Massilia sp. IC2-278]|uniref:hypothetical protein n=1 Tax=Massilia sp. IC2-278 TaxID=2887200 RepID=UPI001E45B3C7|nr:hypothetical protein [Massilia sp. IC2-278]MCC2960756.1 hypothetical protein [Massilia sp. IC2-278]
MNRIFPIAALAFVAILAGCAGGRTSATSGTTVRAAFASQVLHPRPQAQPERGTDGAAAAAAYANYQQSFATPTPQSDSPTFGNSSGK